MRELIVPKKLKKGDTIAFISISGGRAGDADMVKRYEIGKRRFEEIFGVHVIETPHALMGSEYLYQHPEKRAEDLMWALQNEDVKGIICNMGGDDSYRVLPYIDPQVIHDNPKVFMGYSDIATWMAVFAYAGVRAYYGPNVLTPIAQPGTLDEYTEAAIRRTLFETDVIGKIECSKVYTSIEWRDIKPKKIKWSKNDGYYVLQGQGVKRGRCFCLCGGPLQQIMGTEFFPGPDFEYEKLELPRPDAVIYLVSSMQVTKARAEADPIFLKETVDAINTCYGSFADNVHSFYLDINPLFTDETGYLDPQYTGDEVHLYAKHYKIMRQWLMDNTVPQ